MATKVEMGNERHIPRRRDPLRVDNKDPKLRYLWVPKKLVEDYKTDGWEVANASAGSKAKGTSDPRDRAPMQLDGTIQRKDAIVMTIPEEIAVEKFDRPNRELAAWREGRTEQEFSEEARSAGLQPINETRVTRGD